MNNEYESHFQKWYDSDNNAIDYEYEINYAAQRWLESFGYSINGQIQENTPKYVTNGLGKKDDKVSYVWKSVRDNKGIAAIYVTVHCFKNGDWTEKFDTFESGKEFYKSQIGNTSYNPIQHQPKPRHSHVNQSKVSDTEDKLANVQREIALFGQMSTIPTGGQGKYFSDKGITDLLGGIDIRYATENKFGEYAAILLINENNEPQGLQKFYANQLPNGGGNKRFTWGLKKAGTHYVVGKITRDTELVHFCEGFADGIINYAVNQIPTVVCLDAGGLLPITMAYQKKYPNIKGSIICDNDQWKYDRSDNIGVSKGIAAARKTGYKIIIPQFDQFDCESKPTDLSDLYTLCGNNGHVISKLKSQSIPTKAFEFLQLKSQYIGLSSQPKNPNDKSDQNQATKKLFKLVLAMVHAANGRILPTPYIVMDDSLQSSIDSLITRLGIFYNFPLSEQKRLSTYAITQLKRVYEDSVIQSNIKIDDKLVEYIRTHGGKVNYFDLELIDGKYRIPLDISIAIENTGNQLSILAAPINTGKTFTIIKRLLRRSLLLNQKPNGWVHLRSLVRTMCKTLNIPSYLDITNEIKEIDSIMGCTLSINKPKFFYDLKDSGFSFFDEIDASYHSIISSDLIPKNHREGVFDALQSFIGKSKTFATSQDIDNLTIQLLIMTRPIKDIELYIANPALTRSEQPLLIHDDSHAMINEIYERAKSGDKLFIVADSVPIIESIAAQLKVLKIDKVIEITSNTSAKNADFFENVNIHVKKYDIVLGTPSIAHGISFDDSPFDAVYGIYCQTATADTFIQMISRDRNPSQINLAFKSERKSKSNDVNEKYQEMLLMAKAAAIKTFEIVYDHFGVPCGIKNKSVEVGDVIQFSDFDKGNLAMQSENLTGKNYDVGLLIRRLIATGCKLSHISHTPEVKESAKRENTAITKAYKQSEMDKILVEGQLGLAGKSLQEIQEIVINRDKFQPPTNPEKAAIIMVRYQVDDLNEPLVKFHQDNGPSKIKLLEQTITSKESAIALDKLQLEKWSSTLLDHSRIKQTFNQMLIGVLGLTFDGDCNLISEPIQFTSKTKEIVNLVKTISQKKSITVFNAVMNVKLTTKTKNVPVIFIKAWAATMGIKLESKLLSVNNKKGKYYTTDINWLKVILKPIQSRRLLGENVFEQIAETELGLDLFPEMRGYESISPTVAVEINPIQAPQNYDYYGAMEILIKMFSGSCPLNLTQIQKDFTPSEIDILINKGYLIENGDGNFTCKFV